MIYNNDENAPQEDDYVYNENDNYGYMPIGPDVRVRLPYSSTYTTSSLRREVFSDRGKTKMELQKLRRIKQEHQAMIECLDTELEKIGFLVFNDLEDERIAIGKTLNCIGEHALLIDYKMDMLENHLDNLMSFWRSWLTRGIGENVPQYNLN
jgi:hypothetical protein